MGSGVGGSNYQLFLLEIPCKKVIRRCGAALLRHLYCLMICDNLSRRWSAFPHFRTWLVSSIYQYPHPLGHYSMGHLPIWFIDEPVGSSCAVIQVAHICWYLVAIYEAPLSTFQSTNWQFSLLRVPILCHRDRTGVPKMDYSIPSFMFVDVFLQDGEIVLLILGLQESQLIDATFPLG